MSVTESRIGRWQAENGNGALRITPELVALPGARERLIRAIGEQRGLSVPGLAPVLDLVARPDTEVATAIWLLVGGPVQPTLDQVVADGTVGATAILDALTAAAVTLAGLHRVGRVHGDFDGGSIVVAERPQVIGLGVRSALSGRDSAAKEDIEAWADVAEHIGTVLVGRDPLGGAAMRAAASARMYGLSEAAAELRTAATSEPSTDRTMLASPNPDPPRSAGESAAQRTMAASRIETVEHAGRQSVDPGPAQEVTLLGRLPAASASAPRTADEALRFGPGIDLAAPAVARPQPMRRRRRRLVPTLGTVLILGTVAVAFLWWHGAFGHLRVSGASVAVVSTARCGDTVDIAGHIATNGHPGVVRYHWLRSDGSDSGVLSQNVWPGQQVITVHLRWALRGAARFRPTATLVVDSPEHARAAGSFLYRCP